MAQPHLHAPQGPTSRGPSPPRFLFVFSRAQAVVDLVHRDRVGEKVDKTLLANMVQVYVELGVLEEQPIQFYKKEFQVRSLLSAVSSLTIYLGAIRRENP